MTLLFFSAACDFCDGNVAIDYDVGYVVYRGAISGELHEEYVFRSPVDAERWQMAVGLDDLDIRKVHCEYPFKWRVSTGTIKGLELANHLYTIHPDRFYAPDPNHAHVTPV